MAKFEEKPFEPSPLMIAQVSDIEERIAALRTQIESLGHDKSELVTGEARNRAQLKVGDVVQARYRRKLIPHRITRVLGSWYDIQGTYRVMIEYIAQPQLKNSYGDEVRVFPEEI